MSEETKSRVKDIVEWVACIIIALIIAIAFRYFVGTPTIVQQPSMRPTLEPDQRLWLNRWVRTIKKMPQRGDIITFEAPSQDKLTLTANEILESSIARYENNKKSFWNKFSYYVLEVNKISYIKRVIGLPGETISCENNTIYVNSRKIDDKFGSGVTSDFKKITLGKDEYFVLGDNRENSLDSRYYGPFKKKEIKGSTKLIVFPFHKIGKVK